MPTLLALALYLVHVNLASVDATTETTVFEYSFDDADADPFAPFPIGNSPFFHFMDGDGTIYNDGTARIVGDELVLKATPFTITSPLGPSGGLDHVKSLQYAMTDDGPFETIKVPKKGTLRYSATISGKMHSSDDESFGPFYVTDPSDDIRLGSPAMTTIDFESFVVADFFLSNKGIYAFYERLPFGQTQRNFYYSFSSAKKVFDRMNPNQKHDLAIEYDRKKGAIRWYVGNILVMEADKIGYAISGDPDVNILLDHGGNEEVVDMTGFSPGFGLFTLLDMADPLNPYENFGLVKLSNITGFYAYPINFVDEQSRVENRIFGQGAQLSISAIKVTLAT